MLSAGSDDYHASDPVLRLLYLRRPHRAVCRRTPNEPYLIQSAKVQNQQPVTGGALLEHLHSSLLKGGSNMTKRRFFDAGGVTLLTLSLGPDGSDGLPVIGTNCVNDGKNMPRCKQANSSRQ